MMEPIPESASALGRTGGIGYLPFFSSSPSSSFSFLDIFSWGGGGRHGKGWPRPFSSIRLLPAVGTTLAFHGGPMLFALQYNIKIAPRKRKGARAREREQRCLLSFEPPCFGAAHAGISHPMSKPNNRPTWCLKYVSGLERYGGSLPGLLRDCRKERKTRNEMSHL